MRIEIPHEFARMGAIIFHGLQWVFKLDSGLEPSDTSPQNRNSALQSIPYDTLSFESESAKS